MTARFYLPAVALCLLLFAGACRHKKTAVSKGRVKKQVAVKQPEKISEPAAEPAALGMAALKQKLGVSEKEIRESKLLSFISDWYGAPYKYGGCQKTGVDCSCFTSLLCDKVYNLRLSRSAADMYKECDKVTLEEAKEGDLIFFKISGASISHVGVYLKNKLFVHASTSKGVIINSMEEAYYKKYFHAGGRIKSL